MYLLHSRSGPESPGLWWAGDGWWVRRKDKAKRFATAEAAEAEKLAWITVEIVKDEEAENANS